jgi:hypothetical protein
MDIVAQLVAGIVALWAVLSTFVGSGFKFLLDERKEMKLERAAEKAAYELKLEAASQLIIRQNDSMQKQIDAQTLLVGHQQQMIEALQLLAKPGSS